MIGVFMLTWRELLSRYIVLGLLVICTLVWGMLAFAVNLEIVDGALAGLRIFGKAAQNEAGPGGKPLSVASFVMGIQMFLSGATYWTAMLLGLFATAPLPGSMTERGRIDLLLSKPISRAGILTGHLLGIGAVVAAVATYLFTACWITLAVKTGVWDATFLLSIPIVLAQFLVMYGVLLLLVLLTESTPLALIVTYGIIFASIILALREQLAPQIRLPWRYAYLGLYHLLPHIAETTVLLAQLVEGKAVTTWYPLTGSLLFGAATLALAYGRFLTRDY